MCVFEKAGTMVQRISFQIYAADRVNMSLAIYGNIANVSAYASVQQQLRPVLLVLYSAIVIVGSLANALVILTILSERHMRRKATYIFICSLALSDLLFLLVSVPLFIAAPSLNTWPFGTLMCKAVYYFEYLNGITSVFTLVGLSVDRLYGTRFPFRSKRIRSQRYAVLICSVIWLLSALINIPTIYSFNTTVVPTLDNSSITYCLFDADAEELKTKTLALLVYGYIIPLVLLVAIYYVLLTHLSTQRKRNLQTYTSSYNRDKIRWSQRKKVSMLAISVVAIFFICWCPFHIVSVYRDVAQVRLTIPLLYLHVVSCTMMWSHSAVNPVIYAFISDDFRGGFRRRFSCSGDVWRFVDCRSDK